MQDLSTRTKAFALRIIKLVSSLPDTMEAQVLDKQLLRCGTSLGAHYHESQRARSKTEFIAKIEGGLQELEEARYWLDLILLSNIMSERGSCKSQTHHFPESFGKFTEPGYTISQFFMSSKNCHEKPWKKTKRCEAPHSKELSRFARSSLTTKRLYRSMNEAN